MLIPAQVKPLLLSEDAFIRDAARLYFTQISSPDPEVSSLLIDAWEKYASAGLGGLAELCRYALAPATLDRILEHLGRSIDPLVGRYLNWALAKAPLDLLRENQLRICSTPHCQDDTRQAIDRRLQTAQAGPEDLWDKLQGYCRKFDGPEEAIGEALEIHLADSERIDALIEALTPHEFPHPDTILRVLEEPEFKDRGLRFFVILLAGERRLAQAAPVLHQILHQGAYSLQGNAYEALIKINDAGTAHLIRKAWPHASPDYKENAAELLGYLKHPLSEEVLLELLKQEQDVTLRSLLCSSLCSLFSQQGIPVVLETIQQGYDPSAGCLENEVLVVADALGVKLPQRDAWHARREKKTAFIGALHAHPWESDPDPLPESDAAAKAAKPLNYRALDSTYVLRDAPRVGRNEPCPCGSGKKYKKCCLTE